jgi:hypothetical protein
MTRAMTSLLGGLLLLGSAATWGDSYSDAVTLFRNATESQAFFYHCYGKGGAMYQATVAGQKFS